MTFNKCKGILASQGITVYQEINKKNTYNIQYYKNGKVFEHYAKTYIDLLAQLKITVIKKAEVEKLESEIAELEASIKDIETTEFDIFGELADQEDNQRQINNIRHEIGYKQNKIKNSIIID